MEPEFESRFVFPWNGTCMETDYPEDLEYVVEIKDSKGYEFYQYLKEQMAPSSPDNVVQQLPLTFFDQLHEACRLLFNECSLKETAYCVEEENGVWRAFTFFYLPVACILVIAAPILHGIYHSCRLTVANLGVSDCLLTILTLAKRLADFFLKGTSKWPILYTVNMAWQSTWIVSTFGLLLLVVDIISASMYPRLNTEIFFKIAVPVVWLMSVGTAALLGFFGLEYSFFVQFIICLVTISVFVATLIFILVMYFMAPKIKQDTRKQSLSRDFVMIDSAENDDPDVIGNVNTTLLSLFQKNTDRSHPKYSICTCFFLVLATLFTWMPLVSYFLVKDEVHLRNIIFSQQVLACCLIFFHISAVTRPVIYHFRI